MAGFPDVSLVRRPEAIPAHVRPRADPARGGGDQVEGRHPHPREGAAEGPRGNRRRRGAGRQERADRRNHPHGRQGWSKHIFTRLLFEQEAK